MSKLSSVQLKENRNYGIDLLRIVAMYMIVVLHVLGMGGIIWSDAAASTNYWVAWFLESAAYCAVDVYAMISGFVGYKAKHRYSGLAELWLKVFLYSVSLTLINKLFFDHTIGKRKILLSLFPLTQETYWYFTMYFCLFLFLPVLNTAVEKMQKKELRTVLLFSVLLFSVAPFLWANDPFEAQGGYSAVWLAILYLYGAYIGKYHSFERIKKRVAFLGYLLCITAAWASKYGINRFLPSFFGIENNEDWLINYTSLPILLSGVFLLIIFRDIKPPRTVNIIISIISPLTFCIYIIHCSPLVEKHFMTDKFTSYLSLSPIMMVLAVLGTAAVIFVACAALDFVRAKVFDLLKIRAKLNTIEDRIMNSFIQEKKLRETQYES